MSDNRRVDTKFSLTVTGSSIAVVFAINLLILSYAMFLSWPTAGHVADAQVPEAVEVAPVEDLDTDLGGDPAEAEATLEPELVGPIRATSSFVMAGSDEVSQLYYRHCAACHGQDGTGDGPTAGLLFPKPRNFVKSPFRFASPGGSDDDVLAALERTIAQGVHRSAMPGFGGVLTEPQIAGLATRVLSFKDAESQPPVPELMIDVGRHPPVTEELIARGAELYRSAGCFACHGDTGEGDGIAAAGLRDSAGRPLQPADLASGLFKSGQSAESIARTLMTGVPGTPMISFEPLLIKELPDGSKDATDVWALVSYLRSLGPRPRSPGEASGSVITVHDAPDQAMLSDPAHVAWLGAQEALVGVKPLWQREEETASVHVRVVRFEDELAVCLDWLDESIDLTHGEDVYPDAVAVVFASSEEVPSMPMGIEVAGEPQVDPVNVWYWSGDRQYQAVVESLEGDVEQSQTNGSRWYLFTDGPDAKLPVLTVNEAATPSVDDDARGKTPPDNHAAVEGNAYGIGPITYQDADHQQLTATAAWSDGIWRVVLKRPLTTGDNQDAQFDATGRIPIAVAVWNGSKGDHAGAKLVSGWHWLDLGNTSDSQNTKEGASQ